MVTQGDALAVLRTMPEASVQCCVTSPPYWNLRDYGVEGQIGLEETMGEYVEMLTAVFLEVRRVLKPDGVLWLNLGDSYAAQRSSQVSQTKWKGLDFGKSNSSSIPDGLKPKDLCGIPWRVAFALQDSGWWLRSDVIWCKGNPMPESVKDRPTRAHEYVFLMTKSASYFYDMEAVKEKAECVGDRRFERLDRTQLIASKGGDSRLRTGNPTGDSRNLRSWWQINPEPTPEAHFATFPIRLAERCILAGSKPGDTILDPFAGAGTTWLACLKHGRRFQGIELNPDYVTLAEARVRRIYPLFAG